MPDAQPKPTAAADVLREHGVRTAQGDAWACRCGTTSRMPFEQHQEDVLCAAGLLATPEHDAQVRADAHREWFCADPVAALGYWQVPCDDCAGTGSFPMPDGYDGDSSCVRCKATGWLLLSMVDPGAEAVLAEHDAQVLRDAAKAINYRDADTIRSEGWGEKHNGPTTALDVIRWLRVRADRIEAGDPT